MDDATTDYVPVDSETYAEYERAIMQKMWLRMSWRDAHGRDRLEVVRPVELMTTPRKSEYLIAETREGREYKLRLDWIQSWAPVSAPG